MTRSHEVRRRVAVSTTIVAGLLAVAPAMALAHVERTSYWPDPAPDTSVNPPAGGEVPKARDLFSARSKKRGTTRIVCQADSRARANNAITAARTKGVQDRPTEAPRKFSLKQGRRWRKFEKKLFRDCKYHDVQPAINDSGNYDRVVIMPGVYTEPASRKVPELAAGVRAVPRGLRPRLGRRLLRLPVPLPERPEPHRGPGARAGHRPGPPEQRERAARPARDPELGQVHPLQHADRGLRAVRRRRRHRRRPGRLGQRRSDGLGQGRRHQGRSRRRDRAQGHDRASRRRARRLHPRDRRLPHEPHEVLLRGRVRRAHVHHRPRHDGHVRRRGQRRLGGVSRRGAGHRDVPRHEVLSPRRA